MSTLKNHDIINPDIGHCVMRKNSYLSIGRSVEQNATSDRFMAKLTELTNRSFGHDGSSSTNDDGVVRVIGNPNFKLLLPLEFNLLYIAGVIDSRNKSSSFGLAADKLEEDDEFSDDMRQLYMAYDGIGTDEIALYFNSMTIADKPGYRAGELQLGLNPDPENELAPFLVREAQVCSRGLLRVAPRITQIQAPHVNTVPLLKLSRDVPDDQITDFAGRLEEILPVRLTLGELTIDGVDRRSRSISAQNIQHKL